jgi:uncharacterized protein YdiU (UPF0061 family)
MEDYNPNWTPNTTDRENRRYRFGKQAEIGLWNLYQLANALYPLIQEAAPWNHIRALSNAVSASIFRDDAK